MIETLDGARAGLAARTPKPALSLPRTRPMAKAAKPTLPTAWLSLGGTRDLVAKVLLSVKLADNWLNAGSCTTA
jgi:hypothetical protein